MNSRICPWPFSVKACLVITAGWLSLEAGAQNPVLLRPALQKELGTAGFDFSYSVVTASNGDILAAGTSDGSGGTRTSSAFGGEDFVPMRLDKNLGLRWERSFGGTANDRLFDVSEAASGSILWVGRSLSPVSGNKLAPALGGNDMWTVMTDANGQKLWERTFGGDADDRAFGALRLPDDDFLVVGTSASLPNTVAGGKRTASYGIEDVYAVCVDSRGNYKWEVCYGGTDYDICRCAVLLTNRTIVLVSSSSSSPGGRSNKTTPLVGISDLWLICLDSSGRQLWQASYGETNQFFDLDTRGATATSDGGLMVATARGIPLGDPLDAATIWQNEGLLLKFDSRGKLVQSKAFANPSAGASADPNALNGIVFQRVLPLKRGGYAVSALTDCRKGGVQLQDAAGYNDCLILQVDESLNPLASGLLGGSSNEWMPALAQLPEGMLCVAIESYSGVSGNKTTGNFGSLDNWFVTLSPYHPDSLQALAAVELRFETSAGYTYQLQCSTDLISWTNYGSPFPGTGTPTTNFVSIAETLARFWKLQRQ
jgi:hypothetical protein